MLKANTRPMDLLGVWVVILLLNAVFPTSYSAVCEWDWKIDAAQGLDPSSLDAGARKLSVLREVHDMEHCQMACCAETACQLAMIGTPADGTPECQLVSCMQDGRDVCLLQPSTQFKVYRKKTQVVTEPQNTTEPVPLSPDARALSEGNSTNADKDQCRRGMKVGSCKAAFPRFYYDMDTQSCRKFIYGGCESNGNNFESVQECETACEGVEVPPTSDVPLPEISEDEFARSYQRERESQSEGLTLRKRDQCRSLMKVGSCKAAFTRFYYDMDTQSCRKFIYGGCEGNGNNFESVQECETACEGVKVPPSSDVPLPEISEDEFAHRCGVAPAVGPCRAALPRFFYNSDTHTCQSFIYGGCRGNKNNYGSQENCMVACTVTVLPSPEKSKGKMIPMEHQDSKDHCLVGPEPGPCRAAFPRFFYQPSTGSCLSFIYGGCRGNKNRYETLDDCMSKCDGRGHTGQDAQGNVGGRDRSPAFFLVGTLAVISVLVLTSLIMITLHRNKVLRRSTTISDKEELLPEQGEHSSLESLSVPESPRAGKV
ncbi:kunitz-type protease inhibitor 2 isoform X1 [Gadus chalcogrammus]|uniref:kunitz-type protease inhibitor 2 isoform X1 n=1 Tax=Gadus chalcogrammus TaxID=1042646 RepID=UPI0024C4C47D|nr:kunitz-type protease inhibitor 2 isoform X1 [Gadus chalcogrammus]